MTPLPTSERKCRHSTCGLFFWPGCWRGDWCRISCLPYRYLTWWLLVAVFEIFFLFSRWPEDNKRSVAAAVVGSSPLLRLNLLLDVGSCYLLRRLLSQLLYLVQWVLFPVTVRDVLDCSASPKQSRTSRTVTGTTTPVRTGRSRAFSGFLYMYECILTFILWELRTVSSLALYDSGVRIRFYSNE